MIDQHLWKDSMRLVGCLAAVAGLPAAWLPVGLSDSCHTVIGLPAPCVSALRVDQNKLSRDDLLPSPSPALEPFPISPCTSPGLPPRVIRLESVFLPHSVFPSICLSGLPTTTFPTYLEFHNHSRITFIEKPYQINCSHIKAS